MRPDELKNKLITSLDDLDRQDILNFLLESQVIEYGVAYLLTGLPYLKGPTLEEIEDKSLGQLINEMEKTKDTRLTGLIEKAREFNKLRKDVVHHLIHLPQDKDQILEDIRAKLELAREIKYEIDWQFNWVYENILNIPYGNIF